MKSLEEFRTFYQANLRPTLEVLEARRRKILKTVLAAVVLAAALGGGLILAFPALGAGSGWIGVLLAVAAVAALAWWLASRGFVSDFKHTVIAPIVSFCDPSLRYQPEAGISQGDFTRSGIFRHRIDRYRCEDLVCGRLGATAARFSEVHAEYKTEHTNSKGHRRTQWHTIFKGLFFIGDFNKHFHGRTYVLPDTAQRLFGMFGQKLQAVFGHAGADLVKMEDPEFEKRFMVYSDDQVEARYVLSTSLMSRIAAFREKARAEVHLSFVASCVHVAIAMRRNLFEPRLFRTLLDFETVRQYLEDLRFATGIVEELNLNTRIWTKT